MLSFRKFTVLRCIFILQIIYLLAYLVNLNFLIVLDGVVLLTFVPGLLVLRLLLKKLGGTLDFFANLLIALGISIFFWAIFNFIFSNLFLIFGIKFFTKSTIVLIVNILIFLLLLVNILFCGDEPIKLTLKTTDAIIVVISCLLLCVSILGVYVDSFLHSNYIMLFVIVVIFTIYLAIVLDIIDKKYIPVLIWIISLSLLYMNSMYGYYFRVTDNMFEYYLSQRILKEGCWTPSAFGGLNYMLCVVMVIPMYVLVCSVSLNFIFRILVPFISSFIPVGLYISISKYSDYKFSFLTTFLFLSMYDYFTWVGLTMKMVTAGIYLSLLIMLITDEVLNMVVKRILAVIFGFSLILSHYGTAYIFMACIFGSYLFLKLVCRIKQNMILTRNSFVIFYIVSVLYWCLYSKFLYVLLINLISDTVNDILSRSILPKTSYMAHVIQGKLPSYLQILKVLIFISVIFIIFGILVDVYYHIYKKINKNYKIYEYLSFSILLVSMGSLVFLGGLSGRVTPDRVYMIMLFFLATYCIKGCGYLVDGIYSIVSGFTSISKKIKNFNLLSVLSVYLILFLMFNSCFAAEVIWKYNVGPMISVGGPRIIYNGKLNEKEYLNRVYMSPYDLTGVAWLGKYMVTCGRVYCSSNSKKDFIVMGVTKYLYISSHKVSNINKFSNKFFNKLRLKHGTYLYLSKFNINTGKIKIGGAILPRFISIYNVSMFNRLNKIYVGECSVYYFR